MQAVKTTPTAPRATKPAHAGSPAPLCRRFAWSAAASFGAAFASTVAGAPGKHRPGGRGAALWTRRGGRVHHRARPVSLAALRQQLVDLGRQNEIVLR